MSMYVLFDVCNERERMIETGESVMEYEYTHLIIDEYCTYTCIEQCVKVRRIYEIHML